MTTKNINDLSALATITDSDQIIVRDPEETTFAKTKYALASTLATYVSNQITTTGTYQPGDNDLTAIAALTGAGIPARAAEADWSLRTVTGTANEVSVANGDGAAGNPTLSLPAALTFTGKTVTGGTFDGPTITIADNVLTIVDSADATKKLNFELSGLTTATTRTLTVPDANTTIVGTDTTQTLTNKTLTSPVIATIVNSGTLTLPTSTDTLVGRATTDTLTNKNVTSGTNTFPTFNQNTTGNAATATALETARNIDGVSFNGTANITVIAPGTNAATSKATPVDADEIPIVDSAAANVLKKLTWANLKATAKTYFDTLYEALGAVGTHAALTATHGVAGAIVGTSDSQTLTNKTLTSPVIGTISNTGSLTLPTSTDTLVGKATTDTFTNKTYDTAGTGNAFKINGTTVTTGANIAALFALDDISNISAAAPADGQVITWDNVGGVWVAADAPGAGSGAPTTVSYVTLATDVGLSAERVLTAGSGVGITDAGANGAVTVALDISGLTADATPDVAADYLATYDDSVAANKKVLLTNLPVNATNIGTGTLPDARLSSAATAYGKQCIPIPASAMTARTTNGAASGSVETATNKVMLITLDFDTSTKEYGQFSIPMPDSWNEGTITFQPIWSHAATTTNFGVVFELAALALSNDDAADTALGTAQTSTDTGGTTDDIYIGPESAAITVAGTPAAGDLVIFQVARVPADASDTMAIDARLHGIKLFITTDAGHD